MNNYAQDLGSSSQGSVLYICQDCNVVFSSVLDIDKCPECGSQEVIVFGGIEGGE